MYMRQTDCMCTRALCSSSSFSLCVMQLQLAFDSDFQLAHGCAPMSKNGFSATIFLNASFLISTSVKSHCTPCSFTVVMSILSSRPKYPSTATLSPKRWLCVSDSTCSQLPMNILPSEDSPSACGSDAAFSCAFKCSLSSKSSVWTSAARFLDGRLSVSMAGPLLALEDEAPHVAVMSCLIVTSSSPIRQNSSGGRSHSSDTARLWVDEEGCSCFLASTRACSLARYSLPSSLFCPCTCPSDWLGDDCQPWHILDNQVLDRTSFPNLS